MVVCVIGKWIVFLDYKEFIKMFAANIWILFEFSNKSTS